MTAKELNEENNKRVYCLKRLNLCLWGGSTAFKDLDMCLRSINMQTFNSGHYTPIPIKIKGMSGIFILNEDGLLNFEFKISKIDGYFLIESLTKTGIKEFENRYRSYEQ